MAHTGSFADFKAKLNAQGFEYYQRGKNHGVRVNHEDGKVISYRFATIGASEAFGEYLKALESLKAADAAQDTPQGQTEPKPTPNTDTNDQATQEEPEIDAEIPENDTQSAPDVSDDTQEANTASDGSEATQKAEGSQESETLKEFRDRRDARTERKREKAMKQHKRKGKPR